MLSDHIFEEQFNIRASEVDPNQKATLPAICNLLQEIAGNHARKLTFDITDLQKTQLTWVLHQLQVSMERFPSWRETIIIRTWPSGGDGLRAYRDFLILDEDKNKIGRALSYWLILDLESRRPKRIPKEILDTVPENKDHVLPITENTFSTIEKAETVQAFNVRKADLDLNRHVNNVRYVEWALACLPYDTYPDNITIRFMAEALLGDNIMAEHLADSNGLHFSIKRSPNNKVLALAHSK